MNESPSFFYKSNEISQGHREIGGFLYKIEGQIRILCCLSRNNAPRQKLGAK